MPTLLVDQNVPRVACAWLRERMAGWRVVHVFDLGLAEEPDSVIGERAIAMGAVILTFDEDFLDSRAGLRDRLPVSFDCGSGRPGYRFSSTLSSGS
ncbi:MAG: DUF5615 family PIN-like protein [Dehalococcoidia bacterium]|nr:DUF5615 family PIN-like protein [Dehalococcoidia bacterium]